MGGAFALLLASPNHGFSASAPITAKCLKMLIPFLPALVRSSAAFGKKDLSLRNAANKLEQALTINRVPHNVKEYPEAGHGFLNNHIPSEIPVVLRVLLNLMGGGYHKLSADDARHRISDFFRIHLKTE